MVEWRATLHLSNWASYRTPGMHGPSGRKWTIMARPRPWERGLGRVACLTPLPEWLDMVRKGEMPMEVYRECIEAQVVRDENEIGPGSRDGQVYGDLWADPWVPFSKETLPLTVRGPSNEFEVRDGDTLCCACAVAEARAGRCHRTFVAPLLASAGWRVILDGVEIDASGAPVPDPDIRSSHHPDRNVTR